MLVEDTITQTVRTALDESAFYAEHGLRPRPRVVEGSPDQVWEVIADLRNRTRRECLSMEDPSHLDRSDLPDHLIARGPATLEVMIRRGVRLRQITTHRGLRADEKYRTILWRQGGEARAVDRLPAKTCILDRSVALVPKDLSVLVRGMLVITDPVLVRLLLDIYRTMWSAGVPATSPVPAPPAHLSGVLEALASGMPDDRAALSVGLSCRTYSRRVAELVRLLGASSRFQAGIEAARRGWL